MAKRKLKTEVVTTTKSAPSKKYAGEYVEHTGPTYAKDTDPQWDVMERGGEAYVVDQGRKHFPRGPFVGDVAERVARQLSREGVTRNPTAPLPAYRYLTAANRHLHEAGRKYYETQGDAIVATEQALKSAGIEYEWDTVGALPFQHIAQETTKTYGPYEVSPGLWLRMDIYRMATGRYELNAYVSKGRRNPMDSHDLYARISMGSRVTFTDLYGKSHTGRAVMLGPAGWVLNMGGPHGTPQVVGRDNITRVSGGVGHRTVLDERNPAWRGSTDRPRPGQRVTVSHNSGVHSGAVGVVVPESTVRLDGRGIPMLPGEYHPWDGKRARSESFVRLNSGEVISMYNNRLLAVRESNPEATQHLGLKEHPIYSVGAWHVYEAENISLGGAIGPLFVINHRTSHGEYPTISSNGRVVWYKRPELIPAHVKQFVKRWAGRHGMYAAPTRESNPGYYELSPAYGRDYKSKADVIAAWNMGKDFEGDYSLGFKPVNINDIPKPCTVNLRYKRNTQVAVVKVPVDAKAQMGNPRYVGRRSGLTRVVFRWWRGDVIALFPDDHEGPGLVSSYQHVGQHGQADYGMIVSESRPATQSEYADLKRELEDSGYNLQVASSYVRSRYQNPEAEAAEVYEDFHGKPANRVDEYMVDEHYHEYLGELGDMISLKVNTLTNLAVEFTFESAPPKLASSEDRAQLYFVGGNQSIDLGGIDMSGDEWVKDSMVIGVVTEITYETEKKFNKFEKIQYYHEPGEESGVQPLLLYDPRSKLMSIAGGQYLVKPEGIVN